MNLFWNNIIALGAVAVAVALLVARNIEGDRSDELLNVSYDATRELYADLDQQFVSQYAKATGKKLIVKQSHGGSSRQAQAVIYGLEADVVTLAFFTDIDALRKRGLISDGWVGRLPHDSTPYFSTVVFVVRKGNPKNIKDWPDLIRPNVAVITPNPKTSGNGKLSFLAAWESVVCRGGTEQEARDFLRAVFEHVSRLGTSSRDAATTFSEELEGDVHLTWENEALRETEESKGELEVVYPPVSIRAEPKVAWVDVNVSRRKTEPYARAYLDFLYTDQAQETMARFGYRPLNPKILGRYAQRFPRIELFPVTMIARDWEEAQTKFFAENGIFDAIYKPKAN